MYSMVLKNGKTAGWYFNEHEFPDIKAPEQDYMYVTIPSGETEMANELIRRGFRFTERSITMEIPLKRFSPAVMPGKKFDFVVTEDWRIDSVFSIAEKTFETDWRFVLDLGQKNTNLKNELLYGFLTELKREETIATYLCQEGHLEGFNLWNIRSGAGRVLLGAVSEKYRNSGIALSLYSRTVEAMRERGSSILRDIVASSNISSLNLHAMLVRCAGGAFRFGYCRDNYRKDWYAADV